MSINLALNKSASASDFVPPYSAQRVVDGSTAALSRWLCNTLPCWVNVDLGNVFSIDRWVVKHMSVVPGWPTPGYSIRDFKLQSSIDNNIWSDVDTVLNNTSSITDHSVTPFYARYVRVYITSGLNINPQLSSIMEFEVYEASPKPPEPPLPTRGIRIFD